MSDYKDIANEMFDELANDVEKTINKNAKKKKPTFLIMGIAAFGLLLICACLLIASIHIRTNAAKESYNTAKNEASNTAYQKTADKIINIGEERYHVHNEVNITVESISLEPKLEVLDVEDVSYQIFDEEDKRTKSTAWYRFSGKGTYTINMELSEIIVDEERNYILIRVPKPVLSDFKITNREMLLFKEKGWESISDGYNLARTAETQAFEEIRQSLSSNQDFYQAATNSAETILKNLAIQSNPEIKIEVEVEFFN